LAGPGPKGVEIAPLFLLFSEILQKLWTRPPSGPQAVDQTFYALFQSLTSVSNLGPVRQGRWLAMRLKSKISLPKCDAISF